MHRLLVPVPLLLSLLACVGAPALDEDDSVEAGPVGLFHLVLPDREYHLDGLLVPPGATILQQGGSSLVAADGLSCSGWPAYSAAVRAARAEHFGDTSEILAAQAAALQEVFPEVRILFGATVDVDEASPGAFGASSLSLTQMEARDTGIFPVRSVFSGTEGTVEWTRVDDGSAEGSLLAAGAASGAAVELIGSFEVELCSD